MKALLLARVSTKDQEENNSIPAQLRRLTDYAMRHGFDDTESHQLVESSTKATRKEFAKIIDSIRGSDETVALITDTVDRLQRSFRESVMLDELRNDGKIELHFIRENLVINKDSNSADILRWDMGVMFAKSFVTQLSDNVKRGQGQKLLNGEWGSKAPFGYKNIPGDIVIDEERAPIVCDIFAWYGTDAYSMLEIRKRIMAEHGLRLMKSQIAAILERKFYYGIMSVNGTDYRHRCPTIISKDTYNLAQEIKLGRHKKTFKYAGLPFYYRGLITCGECGMMVTAERSKGHVYYHCTQYKGKHNAPYIREEELTRQFQEAFRAIQPTREQYAEVMAALKASHGDKAKYRAEHETALRAQATKLEKRQERLFETYLDGDIDKQQYEAKRNEIKDDAADIEAKLNTLSGAEDEFYATVESLMDLARNAPVTFASSKIEARRELIVLVLSNLVLEGKQLRWKYKKPFDSMASCANNRSWQGRQDLNLQPTVLETATLPLSYSPVRYRNIIANNTLNKKSVKKLT